MALNLWAGEIPDHQRDDLSKALLAYIIRLHRFQRVCEWVVAKSIRQRSGLYVRSRDLNDMYTSSGLRHQAWMAMEMCYDLNLPPPFYLCALYARMDAAEGRVYQLESSRPWKWQAAIAIVAYAHAKKRSVSKRNLAICLSLPRETLSTWMRQEQWASDLAIEIPRVRLSIESPIT